MKNKDIKKKIIIINKKIQKFIEKNKLYSYINLSLLIFALILLIINSTMGVIFLIIDIILNLIFIECGGFEYMQKQIKKNKRKNSKVSDKTEKLELDSEIKKKTSKKKNNKSKKKKILKALLNLFLLFLLIFLIVAVIFAIYIVIKAPDFDPDNLYRAEASIVYENSGKQIAKLGVEKRKKVAYNDLPQVLVDAIIATEDSRYMQHNGFDAPRFLKASAGQVVNKITGHGNAGGGSTLSMQVVKNNYTSTVSSGFDGIVRKFTDIYIAVFKLEKSYSKEEIMEYYVNTPYLGNSSYGVEQACQSYFGKSVSDINLAEASLIAGLFQAPSSYDPYRYPKLAEERRSTVLYLMKKHGYITEEEEKIAKSISVESLLNKSNPESTQNQYQSYIDIVIEEVEKKTGVNPYTTGMKIYTNLDTSKQEVLNKIMSGETWKWKDDKVQAGIAVVDVNTGALVAVGGGRNRTGERQLNFATDITRQIGSCAKPLFDYGPAYEYNGASEATQVLDAPHTYSGGESIKNADGSYGGLMTYKYAMAASRNIPALKVFQSVDNSKIVEFVTKLGIKPELDSNGFAHEAHALGAFNGASPKQMAGAYAAFANGGYYTEPYAVSKVEYIDTNKTVSTKNKKVKAMSDSTAYMITDALLYAVNSYGNIGGSVSGVQLAAKTGTSNFSTETRKKYGYPSSANNDMWVTGYTPEYAVSLWYGYEQTEKGYYLGNDGYSARGKLFRQVISGISTKGKTFAVPSSVVKGTIEKETYPGLLPSENTPADMRVTEYFKKGTVPTETSGRYARLSDPTGLSASSSGDNTVLTWKAAAPSSYYNQSTLAENLKGLYGKDAAGKASSIISGVGEFGYEVLAQSSSGTTSLGFTTNTKFTTKKQSNDVTYLVKTCFSINKSTQSSGASINVKGSGTSSDNKKDETTKDLLTAVLSNGTINLTLTDGSVTYNDTNDVTITSNGAQINLSDADVSTSISPSTGVTSTSEGFNSTYTFTSAGTYKINYKINYNGSSTSITRTINVN